MRRRLRGAPIICSIALSVLATEGLDAQAIEFHAGPFDMFGGAVWPSDSEMGVCFGARAGLVSLFGRAVHSGIELDWWTAGREDSDLEVRDIVGGIAFWSEFTSASSLHPFLGLGAALHSVDASRKDGTQISDGESLETERLEGYRLGTSGFAGAAIRLTKTGAIWLILEYRYSAVSVVPYHELRLGARVLASAS